MEAITLKQLAKEANRLVKAGHGDRKILLTDDEEINGVHEMTDMFFALDEDSMINLPYGMTIEEAINDYLILG